MRLCCFNFFLRIILPFLITPISSIGQTHPFKTYNIYSLNRNYPPVRKIYLSGGYFKYRVSNNVKIYYGEIVKPNELLNNWDFSQACRIKIGIKIYF